MTIETTNEKLDFKRILPVLVIVLVDLMGLSIIIPLLPLYAARFGAAPFVIGILQSAYPLMQFVGAPILGRLSDRFGRKPILIISQIGTLAGFILLGFANTLLLLFVSRFIDGLSGANIATAQAAIADSTTEKTRTQGLGLVGAAALDSCWAPSLRLSSWPQAGRIIRLLHLPRLSSRSFRYY